MVYFTQSGCVVRDEGAKKSGRGLFYVFSICSPEDDSEGRLPPKVTTLSRLFVSFMLHGLFLCPS
jgi:hypothetical protein